MYYQKNESGFTLIELLVVIAIIGILASVVLVNLNQARAKSRDALRVSQLDQIKKAMEMYYHDNGSYPPHGGTSDGCSGGATCLTDADELVAGDYFATIPFDPIEGNTNLGYRYFRTDTTTGYVLMVRFETDSSTNWCKFVVGNGTNGWVTNTNYRNIETDVLCQP